MGEARHPLGIVATIAIDLPARRGEALARRREHVHQPVVRADIDRAVPFVQHAAERLRCARERVDRVLVDTGLGEHARQAGEPVGTQVGGERVRCAVGERMRLVEDHEIVLG